MEIELKFGDLISEKLAKKGWKQADLSRATKITKSGIRKIINGDSIPKAATVLKLAKALGIDPTIALEAIAESESGDRDLSYHDPYETPLNQACSELQNNQ